MIAEKFSGESNQKYLDWFIFSREFTQVVLEKDYTDIDNLRILKNNTKGEANDLIKDLKVEEALSL